jgi:uncharacterized coiled-coil DUF342 family protein
MSSLNDSRMNLRVYTLEKEVEDLKRTISVIQRESFFSGVVDTMKEIENTLYTKNGGLELRVKELKDLMSKCLKRVTDLESGHEKVKDLEESTKAHCDEIANIHESIGKLEERQQCIREDLNTHENDIRVVAKMVNKKEEMIYEAITKKTRDALDFPLSKIGFIEEQIKEIIKAQEDMRVRISNSQFANTGNMEKVGVAFEALKEVVERLHDRHTNRIGLLEAKLNQNEKDGIILYIDGVPANVYIKREIGDVMAELTALRRYIDSRFDGMSAHLDKLREDLHGLEKCHKRMHKELGAISKLEKRVDESEKRWFIVYDKIFEHFSGIMEAIQSSLPPLGEPLHTV